MIYCKIFRMAAALSVIHFGLPVRAQESAGRSPSIWDGVFTQIQAQRGREMYGSYCAECHKPDLSGDMGPELAGNRFRTNWDSATLDELFGKILKTMPRGAPNLSAATVADVVAYILSANDFPPGNLDLPADTDVLGRIRILGKNGPMPAEIGQLVRTIGCLTPDQSNGWLLTTATQPERSRKSEPSSQSEISSMATRSLGNLIFHLISLDPEAQANKGQKVEVKGLLSEESAIVVTSLRRITEECR
jgi:S-disulfanyl-L-cysteine oxidoreductase SoxD